MRTNNIASRLPAYTLLEVCVVMAISGIVLTVAMPSVRTLVASSTQYVRQTRSPLEQLQTLSMLTVRLREDLPSLVLHSSTHLSANETHYFATPQAVHVTRGRDTLMSSLCDACHWVAGQGAVHLVQAVDSATTGLPGAGIVVASSGR